MTTLHQIIESKVEEFVSDFCYLDKVQSMIPIEEALDFLRQSLRDVALATVEAVKVEEKPCMGNPEMMQSLEDRAHNAAVTLQATKAEEFINGKKQV